MKNFYFLFFQYQYALTVLIILLVIALLIMPRSAVAQSMCEDLHYLISIAPDEFSPIRGRPYDWDGDEILLEWDREFGIKRYNSSYMLPNATECKTSVDATSADYDCEWKFRSSSALYNSYEPMKRSIAVCFAPDEIRNYDSVRNELDSRDHQGDSLEIELVEKNISKNLVSLEVEIYASPDGSKYIHNIYFDLTAEFAK